MSPAPLAHSARDAAHAPQSYGAHVEGVVAGAMRHAQEMLGFAADRALARRLATAVADAATFHDLGKLDPDMQAVLRRGRSARPQWDHIDAGVAHLTQSQAMTAAWLVFSHHAPGLPAKPAHFGRGQTPKLRGGRSLDFEKRAKQVARTDAQLDDLVTLHASQCKSAPPTSDGAAHGLAMRLALSCLVDADHADTACADGAPPPPAAPAPRWAERLAALDAYVASLPGQDGPRGGLRAEFYAACRARAPDAAMIACDGPVGIGKTTAALAYLLRRAMATGARRLFVVAPFTAILSQTAEVLRKALILPDERDRPSDIVAEHHHRADFDDIASRDLAVLWSAPIVLTTAVQWLETLSSNAPAMLRKLHMAPGSVVMFDEAHALAPLSAPRRGEDDSRSLQTLILPQYWRWISELAADWGCSFLFASGSLARVWRLEEVAGEAAPDLPDLVPAPLAARLGAAEMARVRYFTHPRFSAPDDFLATVAASPGPRLVIMNTVQSAAVIAKAARARGLATLHLSNALCPRDRDHVLQEVKQRLSEPGPGDWLLVATSLIEAGVDISFASAFRERFALTSLLQIAGRVNRHGEFSGGGEVHDCMFEAVNGLTSHPDARLSGEVLGDFLREGRLDGAFVAAQLVTLSWRRQLRQDGATSDLVAEAERERRYPDVARLARLIEADTRLVVVDPALHERLRAGAPVSSRELLAGSVQLWAQKVGALGLTPIENRPGVHFWPHAYDAEFLGYMAGALAIAAVARGEAVIW